MGDAGALVRNVIDCAAEVKPMTRYSQSQYHPRSRFAIYRDEVRGGPPRQPKPHGTYAAATRHKRDGDLKGGKRLADVCPACAEADSEYQAKMYLQRKAKRDATAAKRKTRKAS
jgi:hypothetical protein